MAETAKPLDTKAPGPTKTAGPKKAGLRPDLATLAGIALALAGILGGLILEKGSIQDIAQATAFMIVMGGTFGAVLVTTPLPIVLKAFSGLGGVFLERADSTSVAIETLIQFATKARKNGIVSLESEAAALTDPFLRKALNLAVDGTDLQELRKMMETDIALGEHAAEAETKVWESAGGYAPTIGIIGAVMGLIQVMKHLEDIKEVGHGIAVAFVATVYGVGFANIFFLPAASKLRARMQDATLTKEMILEGVIGIVEGLNPTLIRLKLEAYNQNPPTPKKAKRPAEARTAQPVHKAGAASQSDPVRT
ncbi:MAG TPA: flagellar motor protein [Candidatus Acidoferrales bacterium]|jgi:chemotaxis protein MotA|nr:flagellar motor protein [Candidatus Acidoferrales bacterium]